MSISLSGLGKKPAFVKSQVRTASKTHYLLLLFFTGIFGRRRRRRIPSAHVKGYSDSPLPLDVLYCSYHSAQ
jgi:hypothetical protein